MCEKGPISGQTINLKGVPGSSDPLQIAEVYIWDRPQAEDQSELHGRYNNSDNHIFDVTMTDLLFHIQPSCALIWCLTMIQTLRQVKLTLSGNAKRSADTTMPAKPSLTTTGQRFAT